MRVMEREKGERESRPLVPTREARGVLLCRGLQSRLKARAQRSLVAVNIEETVTKQSSRQPSCVKSLETVKMQALEEDRKIGRPNAFHELLMAVEGAHDGAEAAEGRRSHRITAKQRLASAIEDQMNRPKISREQRTTTTVENAPTSRLGQRSTAPFDVLANAIGAREAKEFSKHTLRRAGCDSSSQLIEKFSSVTPTFPTSSSSPIHEILRLMSQSPIHQNASPSSYNKSSTNKTLTPTPLDSLSAKPNLDIDPYGAHPTRPMAPQPLQSSSTDAFMQNFTINNPVLAALKSIQNSSHISALGSFALVFPHSSPTTTSYLSPSQLFALQDPSTLQQALASATTAALLGQQSHLNALRTLQNLQTLQALQSSQNMSSYHPSHAERLLGLLSTNPAHIRSAEDCLKHAENVLNQDFSSNISMASFSPSSQAFGSSPSFPITPCGVTSSQNSFSARPSASTVQFDSPFLSTFSPSSQQAQMSNSQHNDSSLHIDQVSDIHSRTSSAPDTPRSSEDDDSSSTTAAMDTISSMSSLSPTITTASIKFSQAFSNLNPNLSSECARGHSLELNSSSFSPCASHSSINTSPSSDTYSFSSKLLANASSSASSSPASPSSNSSSTSSPPSALEFHNSPALQPGCGRYAEYIHDLKSVCSQCAASGRLRSKKKPLVDSLILLAYFGDGIKRDPHVLEYVIDDSNLARELMNIISSNIRPPSRGTNNSYDNWKRAMGKSFRKSGRSFTPKDDDTARYARHVEEHIARIHRKRKNED